MYKIKDITPEDLRDIEIQNQAEIVQYLGSALDPEEAFELIKKESEGFTKPNAKAEQADALLYALVKRKSIEDNNSLDIYTTSDGFSWRILPLEEAKKRFKDNQQVFAINRSQETEHQIETEKDFDIWQEFAIEHISQPENDKQKPNTLSNEQIRILRVKKETELAVLAMQLKRKKEAKQKRKSA